MRGVKTTILPLLLFVPMHVMAYLEPTHETMSEQAAKVSVLVKDAKIRKDLGLDLAIDDDDQQFPNSKGTKRSVVNLIRDGSAFEDSFVGAINHFFDPISGDSILPVVAKPSPTWALEDKGSIVFPLLQRYSFPDARDYLYKALTVTDETERQKNFGLTFETLGRVIHHIQDMAQPQHARLDGHLKLSDADKPDWFFEDSSRYEKYTKDNPDRLTPLFNLYPPVNAPTDARFFTTSRGFWHTGSGDGYGLAEFTNTNFVSQDTNFLGALRNSQLIALPNPRYPLPIPSPVTPGFEDANVLLQSANKTPPAECASPNTPCVMAFFASEVKDNYRGTSTVNPKASSASIFDQDLQFHGTFVPYRNLDRCLDPTNPATCEEIRTNQIFALNRFNFDEAHKFLIPRAVAYSAGLIDYFFRGKLEAEDIQFTDTGMRLRVRNAIDRRATPAWAKETLHPPGQLVLAFEYQDTSSQKRFGASAPVVLAEEVKPGQASRQMYSFVLPSFLADANEVKYRLVYRGNLGEEKDAIAVGTVDPVSGFLVSPHNALPADGIGGPRLIYRAWGRWHLSKKTGVQAGTMDWRGEYINGQPTRILSFDGPRSRYFPPTISSQFFDSAIYKNGKLFAIAPITVLGAAMMRDEQGDDWLVAVGNDGRKDVIYRRPNKASNSAELYHPQSQPDGWQQVGEFVSPGDYREAKRPWLFNGSGTRAATLRELETPQTLEVVGRRLVILELTLTGGAAIIQPRENVEGWNTKLTETRQGTGESSENFTAVHTVSSEGSGRYVVAVDYRDDQEVTCEIRLEDAATATTRTERAEGVNNSTHDETTHSAEILQCGALSQTLSESRSSVHYRFGRQSGYQYAESSEATHRTIEYLDARHELAAIAENKSKSESQCANDIGQGTGTVDETEQVLFGERRVGVFDAQKQLSSSTCVVKHYFVNFVVGNFEDTTRQRIYPGLFTVNTRTDGGWAVDPAQNLFVSQSKGANHVEGTRFSPEQYFNFLDAGDLSALLGGAPPLGYYFPVKVVQ